MDWMTPEGMEHSVGTANPASEPQWSSACVALVVPADKASAERRIAGLSAISRILIEVSRAGVARAMIALDEPGQLAAAVADDLIRAGRKLAIDWFSPDDIQQPQRQGSTHPILLLSTGAVVGAEALRRLMALAGVTVLLEDGRPVAARLLRAPRTLGLDAVSDSPDARTLVAGPGDAIDLGNPSRASRAILLQTGKVSDGVISRWLNRPVSRLVSGALLHIDGVRPWHATVLTAATAAAMFIALCFGGAPGLIVGGLLFQLASIFDGVDGELARATFRSSETGAAMDTTVDMITNLLFVLGITVGLGHVYGPIYWKIGAADVLAMSTGLAIMTLLVRRESAGASFDLLKHFYARRYPTGPIASLVVVLKALTSRDFFAFAFAVLAATGLSRAIPWVFAGAAAIWLTLVIGAATVLLRRSAVSDERLTSRGHIIPGH